MRCPDAFLAAAAAGQRAGAQRWPGRPLCTGPNGGGTPWDGPGAGMADEVELGDAGMKEWCDWMGRRLAAEGGGESAGARSGRVRFKASTIDFSENKLSANGTKAVCNMLEKYGVRCDVLRLTGNNIGNEGARCIARYLMGSSQAPALELHLSRNRVTMDGVKWLLGCLALHPAYPVWNSDSQRFVPLWLKVENDKTKGASGYKALKSACKQLSCSVCLGETSGAAKCGPRQCVNGGCCDDLKHSCVAHLCGWDRSAASEPLPAPGAHARPMFDKPGRGAVKAPPSNAEAPLRDEPRLLYEDADLAVVLKPPGWSCLSQPTGLDPRWAKLSGLARRAKVGDLMCDAVVPALQAWLLLRFGADPTCDAARDQASDRGMAHRLDVDVSGPLLVGKTLRGYEHAKRQIVLGVLKDYVALVHGTFSTDRGECTAPIDSSRYESEKRVRVSAEGQPAITVWEVVAEYECPETQEAYSLVHCRMVTLKTHQIRAHMHHLGNPVVGDPVYGEGGPPEWCPRLFVHKLRLGFFGVEGEARFETCSLQTAPDLWSALGGLRKVGGMAAKGCGAPGL
ncbi:unnamed protein product [Prorocentrum cordatum]|uniref:Pseudouridine synthase RsuA/RluA-like domain-containing protein n=1 Tax=Prorocentrum cordatum TaxID=2364126 RepID=A0ABN9WF08_9DINO|nr:unnamed protein product [Polarella glacialis]